MTRIAAFLIATFAASFACAAEPTNAQINGAFAKADLDKNGTVSLAEAEHFGIEAAAFEKSNPDKDSSLDKEEFVAALKHQFEAASPDKDGTLDRKEAAKAGVETKTFDAADPDKDGTLDLAEFIVALTMQAK